jgi:7-keto-8-aminopelargonate synthetase-like enzyme
MSTGRPALTVRGIDNKNLNLTTHSKAKAAAKKAIDRYGVGTASAGVTWGVPQELS